MALQPHRKQFTVQEYYRLAEIGVLSHEDRVELIDGEIIVMTAIGSRHAACVVGLMEAFAPRVGGRAQVRIQQPIRLSDLSEPEPDVALVQRSPTRYADAHPGPRQVLLVVEVADTSLGYGQTTKLQLYASAGIAEYWIVNLPDRCIEVYRSPNAGGYQEIRHVTLGEELAPAALPDLSVGASEIL